MMPTLNVAYNSKAIRLSQAILDDIGLGKFPPGAVLPGQGELAKKYKVSRATVFRAIDILSKDGQLIRHSQRGVQVPLEGGSIRGVGHCATERKLAIAAMWASPQHDYAQIKRHEGIRKYAEEHGLKFTNFISPRHEDILEALSKIEDYSLDGVILYPYADVRYKNILQKLIDKKFPVVLSRSCHSLPLSTVMSNDGVGEYQATHYLIDKYHRPAYYLTASAESPQDAPERYEGYKDAMRDAGFGNLIEKYTCIGEVLENDPIYYGKEKHYRPGFAAVGRAVDRIECPASVLSENDANVPDIYDNAAQKGLVIGKDLVVVGFDDLPLAKLLKPSLTTVHAHIEELGYEAGKLLHRLIKQEVQPPVHIHLPLKLIIRESA